MIINKAKNLFVNINFFSRSVKIDTVQSREFNAEMNNYSVKTEIKCEAEEDSGYITPLTQSESIEQLCEFLEFTVSFA